MPDSSPDWPVVEGFPAREEIPVGRRLNLGCGAMILPREEGWVNVDRNASPGVDIQWDFWTVPWPLRGASMNCVLMCHLAEHIPHEVRGWTRATRHRGAWNPPLREDGWFAVFREIHRILRPRGRVYIVSPYGQSEGAMQDPTHTRFIVPRTFAYFQHQDTPDYQVGYQFAVLELLLLGPDILPPEMGEAQAQWEMYTRFNVARTIRIVMERV